MSKKATENAKRTPDDSNIWYPLSLKAIEDAINQSERITTPALQIHHISSTHDLNKARSLQEYFQASNISRFNIALRNPHRTLDCAEMTIVKSPSHLAWLITEYEKQLKQMDKHIQRNAQGKLYIIIYNILDRLRNSFLLFNKSNF